MELTDLAPEESLWRYLDLGKFLELLNSRALYFTRSDQFEDRFEGTVNRHTHATYVMFLENELKKQEKKEISVAFLKHNGEYVEIAEKPGDIGASLSQFLYWIRTYTFINCWHRNQHESEAMWRLYCKNLSESVVIRSSVKKLTAALPREIAMSAVTYIDFAGEKQFHDYFGAPFKMKRISFSHEQEVRLITQDMPIINTTEGRKRFDTDRVNDQLGKSIPLNHLEDVIEEIRLSPFAAPWLEKTLSTLMQKLGITIPIKKSEIEIHPFTAHDKRT